MKMNSINFFSIIKWLFVVLTLSIALFPILWMFNTVFTAPGEAVSLNMRLYPSSLSAGIQNIHKVLTETTYLNSYKISLLFALVQIAGILIICSMAAFEFALFDFPGKKILFFIAITSLMMPIAITLIPSYLLVAKLKWLNSLQGLVVPGLPSAFGLFMITQFMEKLPRDLLDAGKIDGLGHFGLYFHVGLPLSKNALITLAILQFIRTWGNFIWPLVVSTNSRWYTISQLVRWYNDPMTFTTIDVIMAANFLAVIPSIIFYVIFQKKIVAGAALSGIKG